MRMPTLETQFFGWLLVCMKFREKREGSGNVNLVSMRIGRIRRCQSTYDNRYEQEAFRGNACASRVGRLKAEGLQAHPRFDHAAYAGISKSASQEDAPLIQAGAWS